MTKIEQKNRREFVYDAQRPTPTDRWVIPVYKEFLKVKEEILESWKRGVVNGLLIHREYVDLASSRMRVHMSKNGLVPVVSLNPVIGFDNEARLQKYIDFFRVYELYRSKLIEAVRLNIESEIIYSAAHPDNKPPRSLRKIGCNTDRVILLSNLLKIIISSWNAGVFSSQFAEIFLDGKEEFQELSITVRNIGLGETIGEKFVETGNLISDIDTDLIGAFYRYLRKKKDVEIHEAIGSWSTSGTERIRVGR